MNLAPLQRSIQALSAVLAGDPALLAPAPGDLDLPDDTCGDYLVVITLPGGARMIAEQYLASFGSANRSAVALATRNPGVECTVFQARQSHLHRLPAADTDGGTT